MNKREINALIKKINTAKNKIAEQRDILRDLSDEVEAIVEDCGEACYDLERAVDGLSELL